MKLKVERVRLGQIVRNPSQDEQGCFTQENLLLGASAKKIITFQSKVNRKMLNVFVKNTVICPIYNIKSDFDTAAHEIRKSQIKSLRRLALCALSSVTAQYSEQSLDGFQLQGKGKTKDECFCCGGGGCSRNCRCLFRQKASCLDHDYPQFVFILPKLRERTGFQHWYLSLPKSKGECSSMLRGIVFSALLSLFSLYCMFSCVVALLNSDNT